MITLYAGQSRVKYQGLEKSLKKVDEKKLEKYFWTNQPLKNNK